MNGGFCLLPRLHRALHFVARPKFIGPLQQSRFDGADLLIQFRQAAGLKDTRWRGGEVGSKLAELHQQKALKGNKRATNLSRRRLWALVQVTLQRNKERKGKTK